MGSMKSWLLGAAVMAGAAAFVSVPAQAAQFGIYVGVHDRYYVPPSPGPGYYWTAGYMNDGYWVPGRWYFGGYRDRDRHFDRDDYWRGRGRDFDRDRDRDRYRDRDRDRDRDRFRR